MPKVKCTIPNASNNINCINFEPIPGGMLSEEIEQEHVDNFLLVPGFELYVESEPPKPAKGKKSDQIPAADGAPDVGGEAADNPPENPPA